jgi:hypothetical protein
MTVLAVVADVATRNAAVLAVERVDAAVLVDGAAGRRNRGDQRVERGAGTHHAVVRRAAVVLHLRHRQNVRGPQMIDDLRGERGELRRRIERRQALEAEGPDSQLSCAAHQVGDLGGRPVVGGRGRGGGAHDEMTELVVDDADHRAECVAHVHHRQPDEPVLDEDALRVEVGGADDHAAAHAAHARSGAVVGQHGHLSEGAGRAGSDRLVHLHAHALEALVEIDAVGGRVEAAAALHVAGGVVVDHRGGDGAAAAAEYRRGRQRVARREHAPGGAESELRHRQVR